MSWAKLVCGLLAVHVIGGVACGAGFSWQDTQGKYLDLLYDGQKVTRYMYDYDESSEQRMFETYMTNGVRQVHQKFLEKKADAEKAGSTALIHWKNGEGKVMVEEEGTTTVYRPGEEAILVLD